MQEENLRGVSVGGLILLIATALEILAMAHHPSVTTPDISQAIRQISEFSTLGAVVHGVLMGLMLCMVFGLFEFAVRRGMNRPLVRAGLIAYGAGVLVMLGAALVSGFILPDVALSAPHANATDLQIVAQLLHLCRALNQSCANFAVVSMSAGIFLSSLDLTSDAGPRRLVGVLGAAVGLFAAAVILFGWVRLDVHGMREIVLLQAVWSAAVAVLLLRRAI